MCKIASADPNLNQMHNLILDEIELKFISLKGICDSMHSDIKTDKNRQRSYRCPGCEKDNRTEGDQGPIHGVPEECTHPIVLILRKVVPVLIAQILPPLLLLFGIGKPSLKCEVCNEMQHQNKHKKLNMMHNNYL